jgi:hypothetical protein
VESHAVNPETTSADPWLLRLELVAETSGGAKCLPADTLGLALGGGGDRAAAFSLGVVQSLAKGRWLPRVDFLSTVSGGSYTGAFLGRFFDLCGKPGGATGGFPEQTPGAGCDRVARDLRDSRSPPVMWLGQHAASVCPGAGPSGPGDRAGFWRDLVSVYFVAGVAVFAVFGLLNALAYADLPGAYPGIARTTAALTPVTALLPTGWAGPWFVLMELAFWLGVVPLGAAFWMVSREAPETFVAPVLLVAGLLAVAVLLATSNVLGVVLLAVAVLRALGAWSAVRRAEGHHDPRNPARLALAHDHLTTCLGFWLAATVALGAFVAANWAGWRLACLMFEQGATLRVLAAWLAAAVAFPLLSAGVLHLIGGFLVGQRRATARPYLSTALALALGAAPLLVVAAFAGHATFVCGADYVQGLGFTAVAVITSLLLGGRGCVAFVNRSSLLGTFAGRLARVFQGAVNPQRRFHPEGQDPMRAVSGDDVALAQYQPHAAGGPVHLINCALTQTAVGAAPPGAECRPVEPLTVGPAGVSVATRWHSLWGEQSSRVPRLVPLTLGYGPHPFLGRAGGAVAVESLTLSEWTAVSGGGVTSRASHRTGAVYSLLRTLANLRLGYWWNSGLDAAEREAAPSAGGPLRALARFLARRLQTQRLLLAEAIGHFDGPWRRYWHLTDGADFESTGVYELLRRRVPFVIACDAGGEVSRGDSALALLIRLARADLGAEVEEVGREGLDKMKLPPHVARSVGTLEDLAPVDAKVSQVHAALLLVRYPHLPGQTSADAWHGRRQTWLLYLKPTFTGDEPADVRDYAAQHPEFPNDAGVGRQADDVRWENYRRLGEHIGDGLFLHP